MEAASEVVKNLHSNMDVLPSGNIFRELQVVHDTGYFSAQPSLEDRWQQVNAHCLPMIVVVAPSIH